MSTSFPFVLRSIVCTLVVAPGTHVNAQRAFVPKRFELVINAPKKAAGAPAAELSLVLRNISSSAVEITETTPYQDFSFIVKTRGNRDVPKTDFGQRLATEPRHGDRRVARELKPGGSAEYEVDLRMLYRLDNRAHYTVRAIRVLQTSGSALERVASNPIIVTVE